MRVVAGTAGGLNLKSPTGPGTRPTTDKVRGAIFNSLTSIEAVEGAIVADLFAGTGACGIEALSRGARSATFVEKDPAATAVIRHNLQATQLDGKVHTEDVMSFLRRPHRFDVAFVDPPYSFDGWASLLQLLDATIAVCESDRPIEPDRGWAVLRHKRYGGTDVTTLQREAAAA